MPKVKPAITNFSSGEVSPRFEGRLDLPQFTNSCRIIENFMIAPQGGAYRRPGTYFVEKTKTANKKVRLLGLEVDDDNKYTLEFGHDYIRFFENHAKVGDPYEKVTTYTEAEIFQIQVARDHNGVLYMVHPSHPPATLTRVADDDWTLADITFETTSVYQDFNAVGDYPSAITFFSDRLILAATNNQPQAVWGSKPGVYNDFNTTDGFEKTFGGGKRRFRIRWLASKGDILIGTTGGVLFLNSVDGIIDKTEGSIRQQADYACKNIDCQLLGDNVMFVQEGGRKVREFAFREDARSYQAADMTILAEHITEGGINQLALQTEPQTVLLGVRDDGQLLGLMYDKQYKLVGWFRYVTDGVIESVAVISTATEDEVWISVLRGDADAKRYIEYFKPHDWGTDQTDMFYVDSGVTFDGGAAKDISGATKAEPVVITATAHGFLNDQIVKIRNVGGMIELNTLHRGYYMVKNKDANTFELYLVDGTTPVDGTEFTIFDKTITGDTTHYSTTISSVSSADIDTLFLGMSITGSGIPAGTTITQIGSVSFEISAEATATATGVTLTVMGTAQRVTKTVSGLDHLDDKTVQILADGATLPDDVVDSGDATLTEYGNKVHVGLPCPAKLKLQRFDIVTPSGKKFIPNLPVRIYKTLTLKVGPRENKLQKEGFRTGADYMDTAIEPVTDDRHVPFPGGWDRKGDIMIIADEPLSCNILAVLPRMVASG